MLGDSITCFGWVLVGVVSKFSSAILAIKRLSIQSVAETFWQENGAFSTTVPAVEHSLKSRERKRRGRRG